MASPQRRSSPSESHSLISPIGWQRNGHSQVLVPRAYLRTTGIHRKHSCFMFQRRPGADIVLRSRASRPQQQEVRTCRGVSVDRRNAPFIKHSLSYNTRPSFFFWFRFKKASFCFQLFLAKCPEIWVNPIINKAPFEFPTHARCSNFNKYISDNLRAEAFRALGIATAIWSLVRTTRMSPHHQRPLWPGSLRYHPQNCGAVRPNSTGSSRGR